ncbi:MAG: 4'-phosphopantetheinyl transferase superfamily protein [Sedimentibacter sp.]
MIKIYAININFKLSSTTWNDFLDIISKDRKKKINNYYFEKDKKHCIYAELILRYSLLKEYNINDKELEIEYNQYGKPKLKKYKNIYFNISHSGNWVVCALGKWEIGVDVEKIDTLSLNVAKNIFTKMEYNNLILCRENPEELFYKLWTLKESYVKAIGKGLQIPFSVLEFRFSNQTIYFYTNSTLNNQYDFVTYKIDQMHRVSICSLSSPIPLCENFCKKIIKPEQIIEFAR